MNKWNIGWGAVSECNMKCQFCYSQKVRKDSTDFFKMIGFLLLIIIMNM